jgi:hypothetical protein
MKNYVLVGDIHSQYHQLTEALTYIKNNVDNYYIVFLGDLFDSRVNYSNSLGVYTTIKSLQEENKCVVLQSNHQDKHIRYLKGNKVFLNNGLDTTIQDFKNSQVESNEIYKWLSSFPYGIVFKDKDGLEYRCSHAYFSSKIFVPTDYEEEYFVNLVSKHTKSKCLYGPVKDNSRVEWWTKESSHSWIRVAGHYHTVHIDLETTKALVLDAECGSDGGKLCVYNVNSKEANYF